MKQLYPNIYLLPSEYSLGYSYFVTRPQGNLLIPNGLRATELSALSDQLDTKGGVSAVLACCRHNVKARSSATDALCVHYGAPLFIGAPDARGTMIAAGDHVRTLPFQETAIESDLDFIPLVGYTDGSGGYLWRDGDRTYLFTGVTLTRTDGNWKVWTSAAKAKKCAEGFERMKATAFDVLLVNSYSNTPPAWYEWSPQEKTAVLDEVIHQTRAA